MEKERKIKTLSLVALIVAVLGLTVAFAALSQTLTINGTASVNAAEWDVHIEDLEKVLVEGSAEVLSEPTIGSDGKSIKNLRVSLAKPGDQVEYTWKYVNAGTIDAIITDDILQGVSLNSISDIDEDSAEYYEFFVEALEKMYPEADWDGDGVTTPEERGKAFESIMYSRRGWGNNTISAGNSVSSGITIMWNNDSTELPKGNIVMNIDYAFVFSQK